MHLFRALLSRTEGYVGETAPHHRPALEVSPTEVLSGAALMSLSKQQRRTGPLAPPSWALTRGKPRHTAV